MSSRLHHLRPRKKQRQANRTIRFLVVLLFVMIFALAVALAATGRGVPAGRIIPLSGRRKRPRPVVGSGLRPGSGWPDRAGRSRACRPCSEDGCDEREEGEDRSGEGGQLGREDQGHGLGYSCSLRSPSGWRIHPMPAASRKRRMAPMSATLAPRGKVRLWW